MVVAGTHHTLWPFRKEPQAGRQAIRSSVVNVEIFSPSPIGLRGSACRWCSLVLNTGRELAVARTSDSHHDAPRLLGAVASWVAPALTFLQILWLKREQVKEQEQEQEQHQNEEDNTKTKKTTGRRATWTHTFPLSHLTSVCHLVMTKNSLRKMSASSCSGGLGTRTLLLQSNKTAGGEVRGDENRAINTSEEIEGGTGKGLSSWRSVWCLIPPAVSPWQRQACYPDDDKQNAVVPANLRPR